MNAPLFIIAGTGTEIGKTVVATALVAELARRGLRVAGVKPIESGTGGGDAADVAALGQVSTFHVTRFPPPYLLADPVSPHLAARREGVIIAIPTVVAWANSIRAEADLVVLELAGGLFSPLDDTSTNADLARALGPTALLLVAPDRLGVLHDVASTALAARTLGLGLDALILSAPAERDPSTGTNAAELHRLPNAPPLIIEFPRDDDRTTPITTLADILLARR